MFRLTTFGGVQLREDGVPHAGVLSQRRRLAVLILIGAGGGAPVPRDKLVAWLWPDADRDHARQSLRQLLHVLQRTFPAHRLVLGGDALELDPDSISTDMQDLESAVKAGRHEAVVALYHGPFLDGFFLSDAPGFERWADTRRLRYAGYFTAALEALAEGAVSAGHDAEAVGWWRRLTAEDNLSGRYALGLMRALAESGDRTGALRVASLHEALVRQELELELDPGVAALAARLREGEPATPASSHNPAGRVGRSRERARDRQRGWLERTFADRFLLSPAPPSRGTVSAYPAHDLRSGDDIDIHLLDPGVSATADPDILLEALSRVAALRGPHLVPILEAGDAEGLVYFLTPRLGGETLRDLLARERQLPVGEAVTIADGIAEALGVAHDAGIIHGDLRPKQVRMTAGAPSLAGVGVAAALLAATGSARSSSTLRIGSVSYQSPQQLAGDLRTDARSDLYSLGCILYEMLVGEVPFASADRAAIVSGRLTGAPPSLTTRRDTVSGALDGVVRRCLARAAADRFPTAGSFREALRAARGG